MRRASGQDSCSEEPGRLAAPQLRKWREFAYQKGSLPTRYPNLIRKLLNGKNCNEHRLAPCRWLFSGHSYKPGVYRSAIQCMSPSYVCFECATTIVYEEMLSLSPTFGYHCHRLTEILWTGFSMCSKGPAAPD